MYSTSRANNTESTAKIVSVFEGPDADHLRQHLATTPREDIEQENLNAYGRVASLYSRHCTDGRIFGRRATKPNPDHGILRRQKDMGPVAG